jgi:UDP-2,3-diacylglucosamine hydrolase
LVLHGDDLCTDDIEYLQFRDLVRQPTWQQEFLSKPLPERRAFAEQARQQSKNATASKDNSIMDVNAGAVEKRLIEQGQSLMIHGHTHRPQVHELQLSHPVAGSHEARRVV